jgi:hypothetical protein
MSQVRVFEQGVMLRSHNGMDQNTPLKSQLPTICKRKERRQEFQK